MTRFSDPLRRTAAQSGTEASRPVAAVVAVTLLHVVCLTVGFLVLIAIFDFPDILRVPAAQRLAMFAQNENIIVPTYWALAMTGLTQAALAVLLLLCAPRRDEPWLVMAALFGVLCGAFQTIGFIRWPVVIPYLADMMADARTPDAQAVVALTEGIMNRFAGMAVGEHLGFVGMGLWTLFLGAAILRQPFVDRRLGWPGVGLGVLALAMAMEPLGGVFAAWGILTAGVFAVWTSWLVLMADSLLRNGAGDADRRALPAWIWATAGLYAAAAGIQGYLA